MSQEKSNQKDYPNEGGENQTSSQHHPASGLTHQEARGWSGASPWVVLVDDEPEILEEMADLFESSDYVCKTASNAREALALLKEHHEIGIMVTDLKMPEIDGIELVGMVRKEISPHRHMEIVVITGHAGMEEAIEALRLGASDFLIKPVTPEKLLAAVNKASQSILIRGLKRLEGKRVASQLKAREQERGNLTRSLADTKSKLGQSTQELEIANRVKDEFLSLVSHELRAPLATIIAVSDFLVVSGEDEGDDSKKEFHKMITESGLRLTQVIDTILELVDLRAGKTHLDKQTIHLPGLIDRVLEVYQPKIAAAQLKLNYSPPESLPSLLGDPGRIAQIFGNILDNAIKFSQAGSEISIKVASSSDEIQIEIKDQGKGMTKEEVGFIFDAFRQVDGSQSKSAYGLGLGLTLTQMYLELHDGTIAIESVPEQGTKVTIGLPLGDA